MNFNNSNVQGGASELKETWNNNLATTFEATHDGHHEEILLKKKHHFKNFDLHSSKHKNKKSHFSELSQEDQDKIRGVLFIYGQVLHRRCSVP